MKFIHIGDIHASRERFNVVNKVLSTLTDRCKLGDIDAVLICGDFWDSTITNTDASHFNDYVNLIKKLTTYTTVVMIYGTPSHEPAGSLTIFKHVGAIVIDKYEPYFTLIPCLYGTFELIALPEPRLSLLVGDSIKAKNEYKNKLYEDFKNKLKDQKKDYPRICMFHNEVSGMKYQNGQEIKSSILGLSESYLKSLNCDYYAGAHIHLPQDLKTIPGGYCGSAAPLDFGEKHNASYIEVEI